MRKFIKVNGRDVAYDSEQYRAIVRVRYRRWIARRGLPPSVSYGLRTVRELRSLCIAIARAGRRA